MPRRTPSSRRSRTSAHAPLEPDVPALGAVFGSELVFRGLLDRMDLGAAFVDQDGRVTFANDYFLEVTGWTRGDLMGRDYFEVFAPIDQRAQRREIFVAAMRSNAGAAPRLTDFVTRDGSVRQFSLATTVLHDDAGNVTGIAGIGADVTAQRTVEGERDRLITAVDQAVESILVVDVEGSVIYANPAAARATGLRSEEARGMRPYEHLPAREGRAFRRALKRVVTSGTAWSGEWRRNGHDGRAHREEVTISPVRDGLGAISSFVVVAHDVTDLRVAEAEIRAALNERVEIDAALRRIRPHATLEATAQAICDEIVRLSGVDFAAIDAFEGPEALVVIGAAGSPVSPGEYVPVERAATLRDRAASGPWAEVWLDRTDEFGKRLSASGIQAVAICPIESDGGSVGLLFVGTRSPAYASHLVERLPAAVEFANTAKALLGPGLQARRDEVKLRGSN